MQICRELAGFSYGRADLVRRAMSKKKHAIMQQEREHFIYGMKREDGSIECPGCIANGVPETVANEIFDEMSAFASYAFNKSHAAAYAYVSYQTAYLKCHYPTEYMAALLTSVLDHTTKMVAYIDECRKMGISLLPPDVNESIEGFAAVGNRRIRFGLLAGKNLGRTIVRSLIEKREQDGPYRDPVSYTHLFFDVFDHHRVQIFGKSEISYIHLLDPGMAMERCERLCALQPPVMIVTRSLEIPPMLLEAARHENVPLLRTSENTCDFMSALIAQLNVDLGPRITRHGVLMEIYGDGVLILSLIHI